MLRLTLAFLSWELSSKPISLAIAIGALMFCPLCASGAIGCLFIFGQETKPAETKLPQVEELIKQQRSLIKQYWDIAKKSQGRKLYNQPDLSLEESSRKIVQIELEIARTPHERLASYEKHLQNMLAVDKELTASPNTQGHRVLEYWESKIELLNAEVRLLQARANASKSQTEDEKSKLKGLLTKRVDTVRKLLDARMEAQKQGGPYLGGETRVSLIKLETELSVASQPKERISAYQRYFDNMKSLQQTCEELWKAGRMGDGTYQELSAARLEAEVWLFRALNNQEAATTVRAKDSAKIRTLLKERRTSLQDAWRIRIERFAGYPGNAGEMQRLSLEYCMAEVALASKPFETVDARVAHIARLKQMEKILKKEVERFSSPLQEDEFQESTREWLKASDLIIRAWRLQAEVDLLRLKNEPSSAGK